MYVLPMLQMLWNKTISSGVWKCSCFDLPHSLLYLYFLNAKKVSAHRMKLLTETSPLRHFSAVVKQCIPGYFRSNVGTKVTRYPLCPGALSSETKMALQRTSIAQSIKIHLWNFSELSLQMQLLLQIKCLLQCYKQLEIVIHCVFAHISFVLFIQIQTTLFSLTTEWEHTGWSCLLKLLLLSTYYFWPIHSKITSSPKYTLGSQESSCFY